MMSFGERVEWRLMTEDKEMRNSTTGLKRSKDEHLTCINQYNDFVPQGSVLALFNARDYKTSIASEWSLM